ncbi:MAG: Glycine dehydrogenase [decarboxylating] (glycine cleavage system P1 protein) [Candidatus Kapaibacterium sp.]|nr:MAG: Glycine dehydrogenase [decarboxylating] (glycine cleavage system P1 protein) [Candidatus Kapabacteria bacterium]
MNYVTNTDEQLKEMLQQIGVSKFEDLIDSIPQSIRILDKFELFPALSESEVVKLLYEYSKKNLSSNDYVNFMGLGAYDHFVPALVNFIIDRPEFKTAYTPYQAEVSQGTLQAMYEFQSLICDLTGMDVANASMLDGASALAEALLMANAQNRKTEFVFAGTINPNYLTVCKTITSGRNFTFDFATSSDGTCDLDLLNRKVTEKTSAVIVQQPNAYGNLEEVDEIEKIAHSKGALLIAVVDPISLGIIKSPGEYNADIVVGEGQPLGIPLSFGGPYLGIFATKQEFIRKLPGRLSGMTLDADGKRAFVLTLQTREQQIKRERATSNICTNQGLMMLAATVYLSVMGKEGIKEVAEHCFRKAHYLAEQIKQIPGFRLYNDKPFFREFLLITPVSPKTIIDEGKKRNILAGVDTTKFQGMQPGLLVSVTEKRTLNELDNLIELLKTFSS